MPKKILILPASHFQISVIKYAKEEGYYVVTSDNRPANPGHKLSDASYNVSTTDLEGVLAVAEEENVDGVLAYASDPAAPAAAYIAENMGLPGNPFHAVRTLATKSRYRSFLKQRGFNHPDFVASSGAGLEEFEDTINCELTYPVMIKPVDRSGSKGVSKVEKRTELRIAVAKAANYSLSGEVIAEGYIEKTGPQIGGEAYVYNGNIYMLCLGEQQVAHSVNNPHLPVGMIFPARLPEDVHSAIRCQLQDILKALDYNFGALNLEIMLDGDNIYFMEIGPRSGGNLLPELMSYTTGVNIAEHSVEHSLGHSVYPQIATDTNKVYGYYALHSKMDLVFSGVSISNELDSLIVDETMIIRNGQKANTFESSSELLGVWLLEFSNHRTAKYIYNNIEDMYDLIGADT